MTFHEISWSDLWQDSLISICSCLSNPTTKSCLFYHRKSSWNHHTVWDISFLHFPILHRWNRQGTTAHLSKNKWPSGQVVMVPMILFFFDIPDASTLRIIGPSNGFGWMNLYYAGVGSSKWRQFWGSGYLGQFDFSPAKSLEKHNLWPWFTGPLNLQAIFHHIDFRGNGGFGRYKTGYPVNMDK